MSTIHDVAQLANVSVATVSRVISKIDSVKPETRKRVMDAIHTLNYQPNVLARQLRRKETKSIVVVVPDITNPFFSKVLLGIEQMAHLQNYQVLLGDSRNDVQREYQYVDLLRQKQVDGMILLTARMRREDIEEAAKTYPIVLACEYLEGSIIPTVSIDNISSARKVTDHLMSLGHRRIACITGPLDIILSRDRLRGYMQSVAQHGLDNEPVLVQEGDFTLESGYNLMMKLMALENPPSAVFASNDEMAIGALKAIKAVGKRIPEDIAVVGFDNIQMSVICEPELTTIAQPDYRIGQTAMDILFNLMNVVPVTKTHYVLEDELIIRESCGMEKEKSNRLQKKLG